jgi:hypothetical protein
VTDPAPPVPSKGFRTPPRLDRPAHAIWVICAATKLAIFALAGRAYGYLSDELYFLDAAEHLALGYVDFPPAIAWILAGLTALLGDDLLVLRGFACLVGIGVTIIAMDVTRLLGGRLVAQWTTAIVVMFAPAFLSVQSILTMNVLDQLWWALGFWLLIRYLQGRESRFMWLLGAVFGLSLLTKLAMPAWHAALAVTVLLYARWMLRRAEVWQAVGIMLAVASPFLYWQIANDWPFFEFMRAYNAKPAEAMVIDQPVFGLITTMNPRFLLIWLPGLIWGPVAKDPVVRLLGTAGLLCMALFFAAGVKFYFTTPLFIIFAALGAILWERWLGDRRRWRRVLLASMAVSGIFSIPIAAPVLPPSMLQRAADFIQEGELGAPGPRPAPMGRYFPHFAEMHGWPELTERVTAHYEAIPASERGGVTLMAAFFGQAGALNQLDRADRLPVAYSGHMHYHFWSEDADFSDVLAVGFERTELERLFQDVSVLEVFECERCMARENGLTIARARRPAMDSEAIRSQIKRFYFF